MSLARPKEARVEPVARVYDRLKDQGHGAAILYATLANNKRASNAMAGVMTYLFYGDDPALDFRIRELVILRLAWNTQTAFHYFQHARIASGEVDHDEGEDQSAQDHGGEVSANEIYLTTRPLAEGNWVPAELAVLKMTDELYIDDCITDATWRDLSEHFSAGDIMALIILVGAYRMNAGVINSFGIQLDEGITGWEISPTG